ncbi:hypothetical protein [Nioella sediminis]|jgi:hypothetical protein|nr:hypothetical protein [Nioella sediminis]
MPDDLTLRRAGAADVPALTETISLYRHLGWTVTKATGLKIMMQKPLPRS